VRVPVADHFGADYGGAVTETAPMLKGAKSRGDREKLVLKGEFAMIRNLAILMIFLSGPSFAPPSHAQEISPQKDVVAFVFGTVHPQDKDGKPVAIEMALGTAFFVGYPDPGGGPTFTLGYLVTAKHVLKDVDGSFLKEIKLRVDLKDNQGAEFITNIPVSDEKGNLLWFHDTDDAVDVAALPFLPDLGKFQYRQIPLAMFADDAMIEREKVAEGDSLYFIGLMAQYYGEKKNYPVVRRGTLALMTDEQIDTPTGRQNAFIAELASWPGNSGSPVFLSLTGIRGSTITAGINLRFLGILSGSFLNKVKGTTLEATVTGGNDMETGISFIVPASKVKALLESAPAQAQRDLEILRKGK
jgi:hypothetical protein